MNAQKRILELTDPNYLKLMREIKELLDPNNIMNPGKWEQEAS
ncbi:MAG: FAD-linked oxidase C-terminal domain-containing protein [Candidatus Hodarchaeota archaeon]